MASSDSQIDKPQRGRLKSELNINMGAQQRESFSECTEENTEKERLSPAGQSSL